MIDLARLVPTEELGAPAFEGAWHSIEFQPELETPQRFVIGAAVSGRGKLLGYRVVSEAQGLRCFYGQRFGKETWAWLRQELEAELGRAIGSTVSRFESGSPQVRLGEANFASGSSADSVLSRTFARLTAAIRGDERKVRAGGIPQNELREAVDQLLRKALKLDYGRIAPNQSGTLLKVGETIHSFDISYDDALTASTVVSASYATLAQAQLNVMAGFTDLLNFHRIRARRQVGLAVLLPSTELLPTAVVKSWQDWWSHESYKYRESGLVLLAESSATEDLAMQIADWYPSAA